MFFFRFVFSVSAPLHSEHLNTARYVNPKERIRNDTSKTLFSGLIPVKYMVTYGVKFRVYSWYRCKGMTWQELKSYFSVSCSRYYQHGGYSNLCGVTTIFMIKPVPIVCHVSAAMWSNRAVIYQRHYELFKCCHLWADLWSIYLIAVVLPRWSADRAVCVCARTRVCVCVCVCVCVVGGISVLPSVNSRTKYLISHTPEVA
jgi:hypothetical protein